jgi:hypothetical protein
VLLELEPVQRAERASVRGEVVLAESGEPPEGLRFEDLRGGVLTQEGERFRVDGVLPGRVELALTAAGCELLSIPEIDLEPGVEHDLGPIVLRPATRLTVRVVDESGDAIRGARVELQPLPPERGGVGAETGALRFDERRDGVYTLEKAPRFAWRLRVRCREYKSHTRRLEVRSGERQDLRVVLQRA